MPKFEISFDKIKFFFSIRIAIVNKRLVLEKCEIVFYSIEKLMIHYIFFSSNSLHLEPVND